MECGNRRLHDVAAIIAVTLQTHVFKIEWVVADVGGTPHRPARLEIAGVIRAVVELELSLGAVRRATFGHVDNIERDIHYGF